MEPTNLSGLGRQICRVLRPAFMVVAPEHPLVIEEITERGESNCAEIIAYVDQAKRKTERERMSEEAKKKTGVLLNTKVIHPLTGESLTVWISDYVLMGYGTGAVMAVPAHDERDLHFAQVFNLPVKRALKSESEDLDPDLYLKNLNLAKEKNLGNIERI